MSAHKCEMLKAYHHSHVWSPRHIRMFSFHIRETAVRRKIIASESDKISLTLTREKSFSFSHENFPPTAQTILFLLESCETVSQSFGWTRRCKIVFDLNSSACGVTLKFILETWSTWQSLSCCWWRWLLKLQDISLVLKGKNRNVENTKGKKMLKSSQQKQLDEWIMKRKGKLWSHRRIEKKRN